MIVPLKKPEVICTHESDLDGFVSGLLLQRLAAHLFGHKVRLEAFHNQNWRNRQMREQVAWISDMGFEHRLDKPDWLVVDHHPAEIDPCHARLIHDPAKCASLLAYELCKEHGIASEALERVVHFTNVVDLFLPEHPDFDAASDYGNLIKIYGFWNIYALIAGEIERLHDHPLLEVMAVKRRVENPLGFEWSKSRVQAISEKVGYVETIVGNANLIVHRLLEENITPYPVLVTLFRKGNGLVVVSLRSRNGEAARVAQRLHGGGHPNASGATLPRSVQNISDAVEFLKRELNRQRQEEALASLELAFADLERQQK